MSAESWTKRIGLPAVVAAVVVVVGMAVGGCSKSVAPLEPTPSSSTSVAPFTVLDVVASRPELSTLLDLINATGLAGTLAEGPAFTVFAPTDSAFAALPTGELEQLRSDVDTLRDLLLFHVIPGKIPTADFLPDGVATTAAGLNVSIQYVGGVATVGDATVLGDEIDASNGVVHVIDAVLRPPDIVDVLESAGIYTEFLAAVERAGKTDELRASGPMTVIAPFDVAYQEADPAGLSVLQNDDAALADWVDHLIIDQRVAVGQLAEPLTVATRLGPTVTFVRDGFDATVDGIALAVTDVNAANGLVQVTDEIPFLPETGS